jgi:hypothetical protein
VDGEVYNECEKKLKRNIVQYKGQCPLRADDVAIADKCSEIYFIISGRYDERSIRN